MSLTATSMTYRSPPNTPLTKSNTATVRGPASQLVHHSHKLFDSQRPSGHAILMEGLVHSTSAQGPAACAPPTDAAQQALKTPEQHRVTVTTTERDTVAKMCQSDTRRLPAASLSSQQAPPHYRVIAAAAYPALQPPAQLSSVASAMFKVHFPTKTSVRKACRRGEIFVNGKAQGTGWIVGPGDHIEFAQRDSHSQATRSRQPTSATDSAEVLYEDGHLACVIRPPGHALQGDMDGRPNMHLQLAASTEVGVLQQPCPLAYRWDGETGGLALVAKTKLAFQQLSGAFEAREVSKRFVALVGGRLQGRGMVDIPLDGVPCASEWRALHCVQSCRHGWITTVALQPLTVHRNQLRRHMALMGHPIVGDSSFTYSLAKHYITHQKLLARPRMQEVAPHVNVSFPAEDDHNNSASVALRRMGRGLFADRANAEQHSGSMAMQRLAFENRHSEPERSNHTRRTHYHMHSVEPASLRPVLSKAMPQSPLSGRLLCLWASSILLTHPCSGALLTFETAQPAMFEDICHAEADGWREHEHKYGRYKGSPSAQAPSRKAVATW